MPLKSLFAKLQLAATGTDSDSASEYGTTTSSDKYIFPHTREDVDGPECLHDCASCTVRYPSRFKVEESDALYGRIKGFNTQVLVATGKSDWVRDVADEKGSIMEAIDNSGVKPTNGRLMLSASNIPLPDYAHAASHTTTSVLLLPAFTIIDHVTPASVPDLISHFINPGPTNKMPLSHPPLSLPPLPPSSNLVARPCPHDYLILLCSQKTRDARCGQSAPLLRKEFERHLRPLGLYRDLDDERPGGVGIYFISHVGGHKYSANVLVYRRAGAGAASELDKRTQAVNGQAKEVAAAVAEAVNGAVEVEGAHGEESKQVQESEKLSSREAMQCIWLARVRPEDCENIVRYTLLQGKVVKPERQLRGGFDREKGLATW